MASVAESAVVLPLVEQGIVAFKAGQKAQAFDLFVQTLKQAPRTELAWLWLSAVVIGKAEQRYCLERVLDINPHHTAARQGLQTFPPALVAQPPFVAEEAEALRCTAPGCTRAVSKPGHSLCYQHWKEAKGISTPPAASKSTRPPAEQRAVAATPAVTERSFRDRFPAEHRTTDGHWVRSKAEMLIDNWLYTVGIVHAYERQLPIAEEAYCDFYLPAGSVYIEYWGLGRDAGYAARRTTKQALYRQYQFNLIELSDEHIRNLDDVFPKQLLKYGISVR